VNAEGRQAMASGEVVGASITGLTKLPGSGA
jgi:NADH-quinone oxidoreductase subunit E